VPTNKLLFTVGEVKSLIAAKFSIPYPDIRIYEDQVLSIGNELHGEDITDDNFYIFEATREEVE